MRNRADHSLCFLLASPSVIACMLLGFCTNVAQAEAAIKLKKLLDPVPLYDTFELKIFAPKVRGPKFTKFPSVTFSKGARSIRVEGFFNGNGEGAADGSIWLIRFMPDEEGCWEYSWSFSNDSGQGSFIVGSRRNPKNHGHVIRFGRYLKHDDGTAFFYRGANWPHITEFRPPSARGASKDVYFSDQDWLHFLDRLEATDHNGLFISGMDRTMNNDRQSFNLAWLKRVDSAIEAAGARGLYLFLNLFDTWGRSAVSPYEIEMNSRKQLLDPWAAGNYMHAKRLYIRYMIARYAGYYNVMWELGNEMEHWPNDGDDFSYAANKYYIPWLRQFDPYGLPITLSEHVWRSTDVDIGGAHQSESVAVNEAYPIINTELVNAGAPDAMWKPTTIRNPENRKHYRSAIWRNMIEGGSGSIEASGLFWVEDGGFRSVSAMLADSNVSRVMEDHGRLGRFLDNLENELFDMAPLGPSALGPASITYLSRGKKDEEYVAYFVGGTRSGVLLTLDELSGEYVARWFSPSTGEYTVEVVVSAGSMLTSPWSNQYDVVLHLLKRGLHQNAIVGGGYPSDSGAGMVPNEK